MKTKARRRRPPSQGWKTFLRNHADGIASMDLFVVPTISFRLLYGFLILQHSRRQLLWLAVTARPSAHWIARDRKSTRLNSSHTVISYAVFCLKKKKEKNTIQN